MRCWTRFIHVYKQRRRMSNIRYLIQVNVLKGDLLLEILNEYVSMHPLGYYHYMKIKEGLKCHRNKDVMVAEENAINWLLYIYNL